jgi:hypothetical protein
MDKQPYMDEDLNGAISKGMAVDAHLRAIESDPEKLSKKKLHALHCNIKILYEIKEGCGTHSLKVVYYLILKSQLKNKVKIFFLKIVAN